MNRISPKSLLHSKWTKSNITNKEKHFVITKVEFDEKQNVVKCIIEAVISRHEYTLDWRELKNNHLWKIGWQ